MKNVNSIARKMGVVLSTSGHKMLRSAFHIETEKVDALEIKAFLKDLFPDKYIGLTDSYYYVMSGFDTWRQLIDVDWTDEKKYLKDRFDCDNFAYLFSARMAGIYGLNTGGVCWGGVPGGHYWNAIITKDDNGFHLWMYEPMTDVSVYYEKGKPIIMGNWTYSVKGFRFF